MDGAKSTAAVTALNVAEGRNSCGDSTSRRCVRRSDRAPIL